MIIDMKSIISHLLYTDHFRRVSLSFFLYRDVAFVESLFSSLLFILFDIKQEPLLY